MPTINSFRREATPKEFEQFLAQLSEQLSLPAHIELLDGISEVDTPLGPASVALDRNRGFVAARWLSVGDGLASVFEAHFVTPATKPAQVGLRHWHVNPRESASRSDQVDTPPLWWGASASDVSAAARSSRTGVASFTELACLLASNGNAANQSVGLTEKVAHLSSELAYVQALMREQSDELRHTRAALRDAKQLTAAQAMVVSAATGDTASSLATSPKDLADLPVWCAEHEEAIVVLPRARSGAKQSIYKNPGVIYEALELLAGPYRKLRLGQISKQEWEDTLLPTGLRLNGSVGESIAGMQGDAYFVTWAGRRRMLDLHLGKGGGRDERHCLRVYFFWDPESERVICGSLPGHLDNSLT